MLRHMLTWYGLNRPASIYWINTTSLKNILLEMRYLGNRQVGD